MTYNIDPNNSQKMFTLRELRQQKGLSGLEMADRLGMSLERYYDAENGKPPAWMKRAIRFFDVVFEDGILPTQLKLTEKKEGYRIDADS